MDKIILNVKTKGESDKNSKKIRKEGLIPAVAYGSGDENRELVIAYLDFKRAYEAAGENTIIELVIDGKDKIGVLIHDIQVDSISGDFTHADFFKVDMKKKIETEIPLVFSGESAAVKEQAGVLVKGLSVVAVRCLPGNIPHEFVVDLSALNTFDDRITIKDLNIPSDVESIVGEETLVASVMQQRSEEELTGLDEKIDEDVSVVEDTVEKENGEGEAKEAE
ncbi:50S ribosomal protein L25 [Patescibacteria group bacterium]